MPEFIQKQPNLGKRDDDYVPDSNEQNTGPQPKFTSGPDYTPGQRGTGASRQTDSTLGDIDDVLSQNAAPASGGGGRSPISQSDARAAKNRRVGVGERQKARQNQERTARPLGSKALGSEELGAAEGASMVGGFYKQAGVDEGGIGEGGSRFAVRLKGINRRRKLLAGGGVGGVVGLVLAISLITPVYRIPAIMTDIENRVGQEVDHIVEARAERMVIMYLIGKAGGNPTDYVITNSPLESIWRTMQSRKVERQIYERTGIFFEKKGKVVHVLQDGRDLGPGRNYEEVQKIIDRGTIQTKKNFETIIKYSDIFAPIRLHKAKVEANSFKRRFMGGAPYGAPKAVDDPAKTAAENATRQVEQLSTQEIEQGVAGSIDELRDGWSCTMDGGDACNTFKEQDPNATVPDPNSDAAQHDRANGSSSEVKQEIQQAEAEAKTEAVKNREGGFVSRLIEKLITKITNAAVAKTVSAAIPYIGWIDFAATLQHAFGNVLANDLVRRIPIILKENAYGAIYASWVGYSDQTKAGKMPLAMLAALSKQLGDAGKGQAHHFLYGGKTDGEKISPRVGSDSHSQTLDVMNEVYNNLGFRLTIRGPLEAWYYTIGQVLKLIGALGGNIISFILDATGLSTLWKSTLVSIFGNDWQTELGKFAVKVVMSLYGATIDPLAKGAAMLNNIFTGAAVALNYHCHFFLGCRALTEQQGVTVGIHLQQKQDQEMAMRPLKERLFSAALPDSLTGSLLRAAPANPKPDTIISALLGQVARLPATMLSAFSPKIRATTRADQISQMSQMTGTQWYGATPADLNQDIAPEVRQQLQGQVSCPRTDPTKEFNRCDADTTVITSLKCRWEDCWSQ
jgi:hypothetical protein